VARSKTGQAESGPEDDLAGRQEYVDRRVLTLFEQGFGIKFNILNGIFRGPNYGPLPHDAPDVMEPRGKM
jgi:hypothetical protein